MKSKEFIFLFNIAFLILSVVSDVLYMFLGNPYVFKTFASCVFVVGGAVNFVYCLLNKKECSERPFFKYFMMLGLFFAMLGDILLIDHFVVGAILFAVGHVWFSVSYCYISRVKLVDVIAIACVMVFTECLILLVPIFDFNGMKLIVVAYGLIISVMLGKSIGNAITNKFNAISLIVLIGSLMFFISDAMLLFNVFGGAGKWADYLCLIFYYPAEFVLAVSIYYVSRNKKNQKKTSAVEE